MLDIAALGQFSDIPTYWVTSKGQVMVQERFKNSRKKMSDNMELLKHTLMHICNHYRNRCAHIEEVRLTDVEECRNLLTNGQNLLWILLSILK